MLRAPACVHTQNLTYCMHFYIILFRFSECLFLLDVTVECLMILFRLILVNVLWIFQALT